MQQMAGNGHFLLTTKEGTFPDTRKPNSTGMDWSHGRLTELYQMLLDIQGIMDPKQNLQTPLNCMVRLIYMNLLRMYSTNQVRHEHRGGPRRRFPS